MTSTAWAARGLACLLTAWTLHLQASEPLIVVDDRGGASALPYYEALDLQPRRQGVAQPAIAVPQAPASPAGQASMLPDAAPA